MESALALYASSSTRTPLISQSWRRILGACALQQAVLNFVAAQSEFRTDRYRKERVHDLMPAKKIDSVAARKFCGLGAST